MTAVTNALLKKHEIIPDLVDDFTPKVDVRVLYGSDIHVHEQELTPAETSQVPSVQYESSGDKYYTVALVDPDAPSKADPKFAPWRHWLVVNVRGSDLSTGETAAPYIGPAPPAGTGFHRYTFLVFQQTDKITVSAFNNEKEGRRSFNIRAFAKEHNLGLPIACSYFLAQSKE